MFNFDLNLSTLLIGIGAIIIVGASSAAIGQNPGIAASLAFVGAVPLIIGVFIRLNNGGRDDKQLI